MTRILGLARKVSLAGVAEGWGDECYAMLLPGNYDDLIAAEEVAPKSKEENIKWQLAMLKKKFVSGKVKDSDGNVIDMIVDDVNASILITDRLFASFLGEDADPKADAPVPSPAPKPASDAKPTVTPSSTESNESPGNTSAS